MKLQNSLRLFVGAMLAASMLLSCVKANPIVKRPGGNDVEIDKDPIQNNGGGNEKVPFPEDVAWEGQTNLTFYTKLPVAEAKLMGDSYKTGYDVYIIDFLDGKLNENYVFTTAGKEAYVEIVTPVYSADEAALACGTYNVVEEKYLGSVFSISPGAYDENKDLLPSYVYEQYSSKESDYYLDFVTSGTAQVYFDDKNGYTILLKLKTADKSFQYYFQGDFTNVKSVSTKGGLNRGALRSEMPAASRSGRRALKLVKVD